MASSLRFDARAACEKGFQRKKRLKETFDLILKRCLEQVERACLTQNSIIFNVPRTIPLSPVIYEHDEAVDYMITALVKDRSFFVRNCGNGKLYIRWQSTSSASILKSRDGATHEPDDVPDVDHPFASTLDEPLEQARQSQSTRRLLDNVDRLLDEI